MSLAEFVSSLGSADTGWHEWNVALGSALADGLSEEEWIELAVQWNREAAWWQERCCESIGNGEAAEGTPILSAMLRTAPPEVAIIAVSQLLDRGWIPEGRDMARLQELKGLGRRHDDIEALLNAGVRQ